MFRNTYPPAFYKQLHRYVHKTYRKQLAFENIRRIISNPFKINMFMLKKALSALYYIPTSLYAGWKLNRLENAR
jgi:anaerobic magnesium-protoporphyrin IX monomethyl ester cyclase